MSTQVKRRRGTQAENDAFTGALAEFVFETTNKRIVAHDASKAGGFPHPNFIDNINNKFKLAAGTLSSGVYSMTLPYNPSAYSQGFEVIMIPNANNTGAVNVNVNSIGSVDIKKDDGSGTLVELEADDIKANIPVKLLHNGSSTFIAQLSGGSAASGLELIATSTPTGVATVTFSSIPQTYKGLFVIVDAISSNTATRYLRISAKSGGVGLGVDGFSVNTTTLTAVANYLWGTGVTAIAAGNAFYGSVYIPFYQAIPYTGIGYPSIGRKYSAAWTHDGSAINNQVEGTIRAKTGSTDDGIDTLLFDWNSTGNFDGGTISLYGVL